MVTFLSYIVSLSLCHDRQAFIVVASRTFHDWRDLTFVLNANDVLLNGINWKEIQFLFLQVLKVFQESIEASFEHFYVS